MKILVAIIAFNEEKNIKNTIEDLQKSELDFDIVLIDNGSSDRTVQFAKELGISSVSHCINSGGAMGTVSSYFAYAYKKNYDILCQFDGDGQHISSELIKIINPIKEGISDYVIGSRFLKKEGFQSYAFRRIGIKLFSNIVSLVTHQKITDVTSGFRAYSKNVISFFATNYRHEIYDTSQLIILSHYSGAKIKEVPVKMQERLHGKSEFDFFKSIFFVVKGFISIIGCLLQKSQIKKWKT